MVDTLADRILANDRVQYSRVRVANIPLLPSSLTEADTIPGVTDIQYAESFDQPCPVCTITTTRGVAWIKNGFKTEVDLGYDGLYRRIFTGTIQPRNRPNISEGRLECGGELWKLVRASFDEIRDVGGLTVAQAIAAIFADVNITNYNLSGVPAYTLAADATIQPGTGMAQLDELLKIDGLRVRETGSGQVVVGRYEGQPSAAAFRKYSTTDTPTMRIVAGGLTEDPAWYRTQITVRGARLADGTDVTATVTLSDTSLAQPPLAAGKQITDVFNIPLIWDTAKALAAAIRIAGEHGRIPQAFRLQIPMDMQLEIGTTLNIDAPEWGISGNWLIWGISHNVVSDITECDLRGGPQFGGTINVNPIAQFTFAAENQPLGAQRYTFVTLDATDSYQPDNADEVLTYDWSGDQDAADSPDIDSQTARKFTVRINPTGISVLTVTLIVTNEAGLTATVIRQINITPEGTDTIVVALFAALKTRFAASMDGGENWNFQTGTNVNIVAAAPSDGVHTGYAMFNGGSGEDVLYRTTDGCATAPVQVLAAVGSPFKDIQWDWRNPLRVYALTDSCKLYESLDYGATWHLLADFDDALDLSGNGIGRKLGLPAGGGVWVFGGTGVGTVLIAFIVGEVIGLTTGGELAADLPAASTALAIVDAVDRGDGGGLIIILENYDASDSGVRPIYLTQGGPFTPLDWKRATGLTAGLTTAGRVVLPANAGAGHFHALLNNRDVWHINGTTGVPVCTLQANVLDVGFTPNEGLWMAEEAEGLSSVECHLLAIEDAAGNGAIVKSFDGLVTVDDVLPGMTVWPVVGAKGKDVAIGPPTSAGGAPRVLLGGLLSSPTERFAAWSLGGPNFSKKIFPANLDLDNFWFWQAITSTLWFGFWGPFDGKDNQNDFHVVRTKDGGATWNDLYTVVIAAGYVWQDIQRAADGRLWGVAIDGADGKHMKIAYSDDQGDNWTQSKDDPGTAVEERIMHIVPSPTNPNRIAVMGRDRITAPTLHNCITWITLDRGASWTKNDFNNLYGGVSAKTLNRLMLASNRLVISGFDVDNNEVIWTSDDNGLTWIERKEIVKIGGSAQPIYGPVGNTVGGILFFMYENDTISPIDIQVWRSVDGAQTWQQIVSAALGNKPPQPATNDRYRGGIAYDQGADALYLFGGGEGNTNNIAHVVRAIGVASENPAVWEDVSDQLVPIDGHVRYNTQAGGGTTRGIVVIPS